MHSCPHSSPTKPRVSWAGCRISRDLGASRGSDPSLDPPRWPWRPRTPSPPRMLEAVRTGASPTLRSQQVLVSFLPSVWLEKATLLHELLLNSLAIFVWLQRNWSRSRLQWRLIWKWRYDFSTFLPCGGILLSWFSSYDSIARIHVIPEIYPGCPVIIV